MTWFAHLARLPLRTRLTIASATVMTTVFATAGLFLYGQFKHDLDAELGDALRAQAIDIAALVEAGHGRDVVTTSGERYAQIYETDGRIIATTSAASTLRLLDSRQLRDAARRPLAIDRIRRNGIDLRVQARPAHNGHDAVVAVGDSLATRDHALERLRTLLLIAGPLALVLANVIAYELARAALQPVERMRLQAEQITDRRLGERLSVPNTRDEVAALGGTLNALLDRIEAAVARERRVVSDASHELRTPLTTLRAEVDLALRGQRDEAELRAALESAAEEAERMSRLADDLLVLARADQGRLPLRPEPILAGALLQSAAARAAAAAEERGRAVMVDADVDGALTLLADRDRTVQALDNLMGNALRYGGGTITLSARAHGQAVELHVADEGPGFPKSVLAHAFERFARGDEARASGSGSGLGLAIVDAVARAHGGSAHARNRDGGGADVWVSLPRA
jgi:two-component system, OmpR family, sensor kinase